MIAALDRQSLESAVFASGTGGGRCVACGNSTGCSRSCCWALPAMPAALRDMTDAVDDGPSPTQVQPAPEETSTDPVRKAAGAPPALTQPESTSKPNVARRKSVPARPTATVGKASDRLSANRSAATQSASPVKRTSAEDRPPNPAVPRPSRRCCRRTLPRSGRGPHLRFTHCRFNRRPPPNCLRARAPAALVPRNCDLAARRPVPRQRVRTSNLRRA